ncbi:hypothetical protein SteCoe_33496 [Stentor coeruleus]|uniref:MADS-box domain-containing protein n=1 Tax=Stentor coeruleus TaxID=5963 RepID=A0A1R2AWM3_9CILI|nr:hypothetical protein SteCoe_33496 [Stentor coeruleus]
MHSQIIPHRDRKANRRKLNSKIQTLAKKSAELSTEHSCDILLIIYSQPNKHWIQYCNTSPESLFFGYQTAKDHLEKIEKYDNSNYQNIFSGLSSAENSISPKPTKHIKVNEKPVCFSQPIKVVEKCSDFVKSTMSTISTEYTITKPPDINPPKSGDQQKILQEPFSLNLDKPKEQVNSSDDFEFEAYFGNDDNS